MHILRSNKVFDDAMFAVIAVESVDIRQGETNSFTHVLGQIQPLNVIVCSPDGIKAFDMEARPADLEHLKRDVPGLEATIAAYAPHRNTRVND